jgi:t-SNARE complex subunit (syntaxin)
MDQERERLFAGIEKLGTKFDMFATNTSDRLTKIETMFSMFDKAQNNLSNKVDNVDKVAAEAIASTKSAHKRIDDMEDDVPSQAAFDALKARTDKHDKIIFWIGTLIVGAVVMAVLGTVIVNK